MDRRNSMEIPPTPKIITRSVAKRFQLNTDYKPKHIFFDSEESDNESVNDSLSTEMSQSNDDYIPLSTETSSENESDNESYTEENEESNDESSEESSEESNEEEKEKAYTRNEKKYTSTNFEDEDNDTEKTDDEDTNDYDALLEIYNNPTTLPTLKEIKQKYPECLKILEEVRDEISKSDPNLLIYLNEPLLLKDRIKLLQLYNIYLELYPHTEEWLDMRNRLHLILTEGKTNYKVHSSFTEQEHNKMEEVATKLNYQDSQLTTKYKILNLNTSKENKEVIYTKFTDLYQNKGYDDEYSKLKCWLNWATSIPHDKIKHFPFDNITKFLKEVSYRLDKELYGLTKVKEQILLFLNSKLNNPYMKRCTLGFVGPAGTGKTQMARLLASVMDYPFQQISFGGVSHPEFLKGHDYTYVGSQPGEIVRCLKRMEYKNGILFLDEFEKISPNPTMCSALLHIIDPVQNSEFRDNYLSEITIDLSHIWFVMSMNSLPLDSALKDRIFYIEIPGYNVNDKVNIILKYMLPKALKNINLQEKDITFEEEACYYFINKVSEPDDLGVRTIEKGIFDLVNKIHFAVSHFCNLDNNEIGNISFMNERTKNLKYPVRVNRDLIDDLIENRDMNSSHHHFYT